MVRLFFWLLLALIASLAFIPSYDPLPGVASASDVLNHFAAFSVLTILYRLAHPLHTLKRQFLALMAFGILIEFVQYFLPTRSASAKDLAVDAVTVATALFFYRLHTRYRQMRLNRI